MLPYQRYSALKSSNTAAVTTYTETVARDAYKHAIVVTSSCSGTAFPGDGGWTWNCQRHLLHWRGLQSLRLWWPSGTGLRHGGLLMRGRPRKCALVGPTSCTLAKSTESFIISWLDEETDKVRYCHTNTEDYRNWNVQLSCILQKRYPSRKKCFHRCSRTMRKE